MSRKIFDYQNEIDELSAFLGETKQQVEYKGDGDEISIDDEIIEQAGSAINGDRFKALFSGEWKETYPSQSEADQGLINIIAFYTKNRVQIARIFRRSALGARSKANRKDYVERTITRAFDNQLPDIDIVGNAAAIDKLMNGHHVSVAQLVEPSAHNALVAGSSPAADTIQRPPGYAGEIADYLYSTAPTPILEIAYASAMTMMAGLAGRAYNVLGNGLNLYVVLVAKSGTGKEWAKGGVERLIKEVKENARLNNRLLIDFDNFIGPRRFASISALANTLTKQKSFVSTMDEFGLKLNNMLNIDRNNSHQNELCAGLLEVYGSSGKSSVFRPAAFADITKNTEPVNSPAVSILGLTTPETFYSIVNEESVAQGFLPRFMIIEYTGPAVPLNEYRDKLTCPQFLDSLEKLIDNCNRINFNIDNGKSPCDVVLDSRAKKISAEFSEYARSNQNKSDNPAFTQLWSRAHMKALKNAGLYSINPIDYDNPIIISEHLYAAIDRVNFDVKTLSTKFAKGEVGSPSNENKQYKDMVKHILEYVHKPWQESKGYCRDCEKLHRDKIISFEFFNNRTGMLISIKNDKMGKKFALERTIKMLIDSGKLVDVTSKGGKYGLISKKIYMINDQLLSE